MKTCAFHLMPWPRSEDPISWPYSEDAFDAAYGEDLYQTYLEQLVLCEELGFDMVAVNEHHYTGYGLMPSPNVMASQLVARTSEIQIGIMGNVLPIRGHPIRLAEEVAMLDVLSEGRIFCGFVRGIPSEYVAYGVDPNESRARFAEAWQLIIEAWTREEPFDFDGEYFSYEDVYIWPRPSQDPHPPLWMPAESEKSIQFAVEKEVPIGRIFEGTGQIAQTFDRYRELTERRHGYTPGADRFTPARFIYVGETDEQARAEAEPHLEYFHDILYGGSFRSSAVRAVGDTEYREENAFAYQEAMPDAGRQVLDFDFDDYQASGEIIVGAPETVAAEIRSQYQQLDGFGMLIGLFQFGSLPDELTRENLRRYAEEVMPALDGLGAVPEEAE